MVFVQIFFENQFTDQDEMLLDVMYIFGLSLLNKAE